MDTNEATMASTPKNAVSASTNRTVSPRDITCCTAHSTRLAVGSSAADSWRWRIRQLYSSDFRRPRGKGGMLSLEDESKIAAGCKFMGRWNCCRPHGHEWSSRSARGDSWTFLPVGLYCVCSCSFGEFHLTQNTNCGQSNLQGVQLFHPVPVPSSSTCACSGVTADARITLIKTEYWDRAGGGGNIRYEW